MQLCTLGLVSLDLHACVTVNDDQLGRMQVRRTTFYRKVKCQCRSRAVTTPSVLSYPIIFVLSQTISSLSKFIKKTTIFI